MNNPTALVIDDSRSSRFVLRKFLEVQGFQVDTAENAQDAYFYLRRKRPVVAFLDHLMPGVDGFDALRVMRQDPSLSAMPIVLCSSNESEGFIADACAQGAFDVLPKPPTPADLAAVLDRVRQFVETGRAPPRPVRPVPGRGAAIHADSPGEGAAGESADRFESLSHMLYLQIAELRAQIAHLSLFRQPDDGGLQLSTQDLMQARLEALGHQVEDALTAQNRLLASTIEAQSQRIEAMRTLLMRSLEQDKGYRVSNG